MITFQFRVVNNARGPISSRKVEDIVKEVESLKKQRDDLSAKVQEYQKKVDEIEKGAASDSAITSKMKTDLDNVKKLAGLTDVEGKGILMTLTPQIDIASNQSPVVMSSDLLSIINELNSAGAEAISINDERYTGRTQIREAGFAIIINGTSFDQTKPFIIKAIGKPNLLSKAFDFNGGIVDILKSDGINVKIAEQESVNIYKYNNNLEYKYIK
jgi:uncharacterized protein YlxW (UPF0749 family)